LRKLALADVALARLDLVSLGLTPRPGQEGGRRIANRVLHRGLARVVAEQGLHVGVPYLAGSQLAPVWLDVIEQQALRLLPGLAIRAVSSILDVVGYQFLYRALLSLRRAIGLRIAA